MKLMILKCEAGSIQPIQDVVLLLPDLYPKHFHFLEMRLHEAVTLCCQDPVLWRPVIYFLSWGIKTF